MTVVITERALGRSLIADDLFERLIAWLAEDEQIERQLAERVMDQTLVFLKACADNPDIPLRPSKVVDLGWHTFVLHTHDYAKFCEHVACRFIHHTPEEFALPTSAKETLTPTIEIMKTTGLMVDDSLWTQQAACSQCHSGCTECGQGGSGE